MNYLYLQFYSVTKLTTSQNFLFPLPILKEIARPKSTYIVFWVRRVCFTYNWQVHRQTSDHPHPTNVPRTTSPKVLRRRKEKVVEIGVSRSVTYYRRPRVISVVLVRPPFLSHPSRFLSRRSTRSGGISRKDLRGRSGLLNWKTIRSSRCWCTLRPFTQELDP